MNRKLNLALLIALAFTLSACAGTKDAGTIIEDAPAVVDNSAVDTSNAFGTGYSAQELSDRFGINGNPLDYKTVYFEYNSTAIGERSNIIASAHARNLAARGGVSVSLQGHADERGTRDYNLALGERRANVVADLMNAVGTGGSNLQRLSYGEERPANSEHNEAAWQQNRRVEISY